MPANDSTKSRILNAAGPVFAKKGFRGATVREICDSAKVNLASVNYYFGDKHGLYIETVVHARQMRAEKVPEPDWAATAKPEDKLRGFVSLMLNRVVALKSAPWQVRLLMREIIHPTDACRKLVQDYFRPFLNGLMEVIDELAGEELPQAKRLMLAYSVVGQCMHYRFAGELTAARVEDEGLTDEFDTELLTDHITSFSLSAINNLNSTKTNTLGSIS